MINTWEMVVSGNGIQDMALNNFQQRTIAGFFFVVLLLAAIYVGETTLRAIMCLIIGASLWELARMNKERVLIKILAPAAGIAVYLAWLSDQLSFAVLAVAIVFLVQALWNKHQDGAKNALFMLGSIIYVVLAPLWMTETSGHGIEYDSFLPFSYFILLWSNDTFAYLSGRWLGKTPLWPRHSPKKTVEGFVGGLLLTGVAAGTLSFFDDRLNAGQWAMAAVVVGLGATLGDLFESQLKRGAGVKDSSNLIPGHGGFLDRFDGFYFSAPLFCWYWQQIQII